MQSQDSCLTSQVSGSCQGLPKLTQALVPPGLPYQGTRNVGLKRVLNTWFLYWGPSSQVPQGSQQERESQGCSLGLESCLLKTDTASDCGSWAVGQSETDVVTESLM